jgi:hypothetical protein
MLSIDTRAQLIDHDYYHVLGDKSEGGTGDTQINGPSVDRYWLHWIRQGMTEDLGGTVRREQAVPSKT